MKNISNKERQEEKYCSICQKNKAIWVGFQQEGYCEKCYEAYVFPLLDKY